MHFREYLCRRRQQRLHSSIGGRLPARITREILLTDLTVPGVHIQERTLTLSDLVNADEVFVTSSTRDVLPVSEIEGIHLNRKGEASTVIRQAFRDTSRSMRNLR